MYVISRFIFDFHKNPLYKKVSLVDWFKDMSKTKEPGEFKNIQKPVIKITKKQGALRKSLKIANGL